MTNKSKLFHCSKCGVKHVRPVGKKCTMPSLQAEETGNSSTMVDEESLQSHGRTSTPVIVSNQNTGPSIDSKLEILAHALNEIKKSQSQIITRIDTLETNRSPERSRRTSEVSIWETLTQPDVPENGSSPPLRKSNPAAVPATKTSTNREQTIPILSELRTDLDVQAATQRRISELEALAKESFFIKEGKNPPSMISKSKNNLNASSANVLGSNGSSSNKTVKSGRDRTGGDDNCRVYVPWPQEHCYVGPDRKRVRYDDLTQAQFSTGLFKMVDVETNENTKVNMLKFFASLHQDIVDHGFIPVRGALAVCLSAIEDGRVAWHQYDTLLSLLEQYLLKAESRTTVSNSGNSMHSNQSNVQTRICRNFNAGRCTANTGHLQGGVAYTHYCSYCIRQGMMFAHPESQCKKRAYNNKNSEGRG